MTEPNLALPGDATATTRRPGPPSRKTNIAAEAYQQALRYLEREFEGNAKKLAWLRNTTSLDDLLETAQKAEDKYSQKSQNKNIMRSWIRGLSKRIMYYGQVLDVLAQHHPEYIALVWGALKFVLTGILSHESLVSQLSKAIYYIAKALPRCELSAELYQTDEMRDAMASLYAHILLFLQQVVKWYNVGPAGRALAAMFKPFELSYKDTVDEIMLSAKTIDDISSLASKVEIREIKVWLQGESRKFAERERKLHEMQQKFSDAQAEVSAAVGTILQIVTLDRTRLEEIHLDVKEMRPRVSDMHFNQLLTIIKPKRSPEDDLQKHRSLIRRNSPWRNQNQSIIQLMQSIGEWIAIPKSSFLVLQTQPRAQTRVKEITTELIDLLQPRSKKVIWYLSSTNVEDQGTVSTTDVLRSLVFQSMRLTPELVTSEPSSFTAAKLNAPHSESEWLDFLCRILRRLAKCFLVVEAEDLFKNEQEASQFAELFRQLASRFLDAETAIKLLVVNYGALPLSKLLEGVQGSVLFVSRETPVPPRRRRPGARSMFREARWNSMITK